MNTLKILDGGMGREIKKRLKSFDPILWSASALIDDPALVQNLHEEFIDAGAQIITTNNYMLVPYALEKKGFLHQLENLTALSGELAQKAVQSSEKEVKVAGSLPPLHTTYRPDLLEKDKSFAVETYQKIINALDPYVDIFLAESLNSLQEMYYIVEALQDTSKPLYVAFILDDKNPQNLLDGTPLIEVVPHLNQAPIDAVLFNCCQPQTISSALSYLNDLKHPVGAYANAFLPIEHTWEHGDLRNEDDSITLDAYANYAKEWHSKGMSIIGGCCGIGPEYIAYLSKTLNGNH